MKTIVLFLALLGSVQIASAEEFTLTRGDGKVFSCTDNGGSSVVGVPLCNCFSATGGGYGQVFGSDLTAQCTSIAGNGSKINTCIKMNASIDNVACSCFSATGGGYGIVIGATARAQCRSAAGNGSKLSGCKAL